MKARPKIFALLVSCVPLLGLLLSSKGSFGPHMNQNQVLQSLVARHDTHIRYTIYSLAARISG